MGLQKWFKPLLILGILVNAGGMLSAILEPDGALYATISKMIAQTGDWINLRVEGMDWLDKPHLPFWMAALSFRIFGINGFAYKLPALLCWGLGAWYTYRFAKDLYGKSVAQLSVLIYISAAHLVISNNDVRAEPYLTGFVIGAVFHFYRVYRLAAVPLKKKGGHLIAGAFLAACAVMAKGPFVLITIAAGLILDWITARRWDQFFHPQWWIAAALIALFITPELYCLYVQFDLHPEKLVFGHTGVSGIRFFFWDSQFGRFFNTGPIKGEGDPFFYFHTILWAFLPWSLLLYASVFSKCRSLWRTYGPGNKAVETEEGGFGGTRGRIPGDAICAGAAIVTFFVFSLSRFQLPHYLNMLFPFFSILTAGYLAGLLNGGPAALDFRTYPRKAFALIQHFIAVLLPLLLIMICWFLHGRAWMLVIIFLMILAVLSWLTFRGNDLAAATGRCFWMALLTYAFINFYFYPYILRYQAGTEAAAALDNLVKRDALEGAGFSVYQLQEAPADYSFEFYCNRPVLRIPFDSLPGVSKESPVLVFAPSSFADSLTRKGYQMRDLQKFPNFHISQLTLPFLDYRTRKQAVESYSIISVQH